MFITEGPESYKICLYNEDTTLKHEVQPLNQPVYPDIKNNYARILLEKADRKLVFYHYPAGIHEEADKAIRQKAMQLVGDLALDISELYGEQPFIEEDGKPISGHYELMFIPAHYPASLSYEITAGKSGALTVNFRKWTCHTHFDYAYEYSAISVDGKSGTVIRLEDIFAAPDSIERVAAIASSGDSWDNGDKIWNTQFNAEPAGGHELKADEIIMERIIIKPDGLDILFSEKQKGNYDIGWVAARIPLAMFDRLGMSKKLWTEKD